ncbi:hypothetical protein BgiBS90_036911, partial [Biomphalaria glabrata]
PIYYLAILPSYYCTAPIISPPNQITIFVPPLDHPSLQSLGALFPDQTAIMFFKSG